MQMPTLATAPSPRRRGPALLALGIVAVIFLILGTLIGSIRWSIGPVAYPHVAAQLPPLRLVLDGETNGEISYHYECTTPGAYTGAGVTVAFDPKNNASVSYDLPLSDGTCMMAGEHVGTRGIIGLQTLETWRGVTIKLHVQTPPPPGIAGAGPVTSTIGTRYTVLPNGTLHAA